MKVIKEFIIGSSYFFNKFKDYKSKDIDKLCIVDFFLKNVNTNSLNLRINGKDIFFFRNMNKDEFINDTIKSKNRLKLGKFLIPEFCKYIDFTLEDLNKISDLFNEVDDLHKYQILIKDYYIENKEMKLSNEQLNIVYKEYKKYR